MIFVTIWLDHEYHKKLNLTLRRAGDCQEQTGASRISITAVQGPPKPLAVVQFHHPVQ